jgi:hypothetical protein
VGDFAPVSQYKSLFLLSSRTPLGRASKISALEILAVENFRSGKPQPRYLLPALALSVAEGEKESRFPPTGVFLKLQSAVDIGLATGLCDIGDAFPFVFFRQSGFLGRTNSMLESNLRDNGVPKIEQ